MLLYDRTQGTLARIHTARVNVQDFETLVQLFVIHGQTVEPDNPSEGLLGVSGEDVLDHQEFDKVIKSHRRFQCTGATAAVMMCSIVSATAGSPIMCMLARHVRVYADVGIGSVLDQS